MANSLVNKVIEKEFNRMNDMQFKAVTTVNGPLLVLAGAGSGKTTVLVNRIACLVKYGSAYNCDLSLSDYEREIAERYLSGQIENMPDGVISLDAPKPWEILAITFTNKAANELKERISLKLGESARDIWAGTFHSICGKILRKYASLIGYTSHFTIYDTDDQKRLIKDILKQENLDEKALPVKSVLSAISSAKDKLITPDEYIQNSDFDSRKKLIGAIYKKYQIQLVNNDAMDFDDMINNTVKLLEENPDVLEHLSNKFKYIMVDEYQDTNHAQYVLVSLFSSAHKNICVVGDDDQSIYHFRGATIENILSFEKQYKNAQVIRLEQNYRSTQTILDAANTVIKNNKGRKGKQLWTNNGQGEQIVIYEAGDERDEATFVADKILENVKRGEKFDAHAVLYRTNAQSNAIENVFARSGISYRVIGGMRFFERKEIKDVLAYLHIVDNPYDDLRLKRIINEPKRGIGDTTIKNATSISLSLGISLFEVFQTAGDYPMLSRSAAKLQEFCALIKSIREQTAGKPLNELLDTVLEKTGYIEYLRAQGEEEQDRIDNINELYSTVMQYAAESEEPSLSGFLEEIALVSDIDSLEGEENRVVLMTIHSAKGLEFDNVFLVGMEEGVFPGHQSIFGGEFEIEEERRLAYVAITRARKKLTISRAKSRLLYGSTSFNPPSRFLVEVPDDLCNTISSKLNLHFGGQTGRSSYKKDYSFLDDFNQIPNRSTNNFTATHIKPQKDTNTYKVGTAVEHNTFGVGRVEAVAKIGDDFMLTINFDKVGTKKLMANFAKLKII